MKDTEILEGILRIIGRDDGLMKQFANGLGIEKNELGEFIANVEFPMVSIGLKKSELGELIDSVEFPIINRKDQHLI